MKQRSSRKTTLLRILVGLGLLSGLILIALVFLFFFYDPLAHWSYGKIQPSILPALLPTAEYLSQNPQPLPEGFYVYSRLDATQKKICWDEADNETYDDLTLYLNGELVPKQSYAWYESVSFHFRGGSHTCLETGNIVLSEGLHLLEMHLYPNWWGRPIIHQWAVMVEE